MADSFAIDDRYAYRHSYAASDVPALICVNRCRCVEMPAASRLAYGCAAA